MRTTKQTIIAATANSSPWENARQENVIIRRVRKDKRFQMRKKLDEGTIKRYVAVYQSEKAMPLVRIAIINEVPFLIDGWHRLAALEELGEEKASALVIECGDQQALWLAASANLEHGKPLKSAELRTVFRALVKAKKHRDARGQLLSYREIGQLIGKAYTTIRNWMIADFPKIAAEYGGDDGFVGKGGLKELATPIPSLQEATGSIASALDTFRSIDCPEMRNTIIEATALALREMKEAGNWRAPEF